MRAAATAVLALGVLARAGVGQLAHAEPDWYLPVGDGCRLFVQELGRGRDTAVRLAIIERAGHAAWIDAPAAFRRTLLQALDSASRCR